MRRLALVLACALILPGCAQGGRSISSGDPFSGAIGSQDRPNRIRIEVRNMNFADARLYALRDGGTRISIGTITGKSDQTYDIDWRFNQDIQIEINLLAGPTCLTRRMPVQPGDILELQIQSVFSQSSFCR